MLKQEGLTFAGPFLFGEAITAWMGRISDLPGRWIDMDRAHFYN